MRTGGVAFTGPLIRPALDVGAGFEFRILRGFALGPIVRYSRVFQTESPTYYPEDAQFSSIGIAATLRTDDPAPPAPPDADHDSLPDASDRCPREPVGRQPDPARPGCPLHDTDGDGVFDDVDQCATVPAGAHADPEHTGCPLRDTDADGVFDNVDRCPTAPSGDVADPDRPGCADPDRDSDGLTDHRDACPTVHAGSYPDPQRPGCPSGDRDHDSVIDIHDHCPDQPGAPDPNPLRNGCPGLVQMEQGQIRILRPVFFATSRDTILRRSFPVLTAVANALVAVPSIRRVSIEGHT
ncbi:MAG: thrombospondin type 3 repeat-containing protein, partial [Deltaproteobacteria bacterium]